MKIITATMPMTAARTPSRIESAPSDGPTVTSCRYLMPAGSAPERKRQRQVLRLFGTEGAGDAALVVNLLLDGGHRLHVVVEHHRQLVADVCAGKGREAPSAVAGQSEVDVRTAILIPAGIGGAQVAPADRRRRG